MNREYIQENLKYNKYFWNAKYIMIWINIDIKMYIVDENILLEERGYLKCAVLLPDRTWMNHKAIKLIKNIVIIS